MGETRTISHLQLPPYSVGETGDASPAAASRHGASRAGPDSVLTAKEGFPFTLMRVVSGAQLPGSTSMGSVCGSPGALMERCASGSRSGPPDGPVKGG